MNSIFTLISSVFLVCFFIGLIKPTVFKKFFKEKTNRKTVSLVFLGIAIVFCVLAGGANSPETNITSNSSASTTNTISQKTVTYEDRIKALITDPEMSYTNTEISADPDHSELQMFTVKLNVASYYDKDSVMRDTGKLSSSIFQEVYASNPKAFSVVVWYMADVTDKYGQKKNDIFISHSIDKPTYEKINWQNFDSSTLCEFLRSETSNNANDICVIKATLK